MGLRRQRRYHGRRDDPTTATPRRTPNAEWRTPKDLCAMQIIERRHTFVSWSLHARNFRLIVGTMAIHRSADIRNFAIVGHASSGKTILSEAMLVCSGVANRMGRIADGTTVS